MALENKMKNGKHADPRTDEFDFSAYAADARAPEAFYGLPPTVEFCANCVISNQRPNSTVEQKHTRESKKETIRFDAQGVCDACRVAERKNANIDWAARRAALVALCDQHRSRNGSYDCIVPGSGGKDSFYQSWVLKYEFGMNPLTVTWAPNIYTDWGWRNFNRWIGSGFDNYLMTPNGRVKRILTRLAVENLFHPFQPFIVGQKSFAPKMALRMGIPLLFYGENEAEYGNPASDTETPLRDNAFHSTLEDDSQTFLGGTSIRSLVEDYGIRPADLEIYKRSNLTELQQKQIEVHYLGYYLKWHPQGAYYHAVEHGGFEPSPERTPGTYSKYNSIDDRIDDLHYYTTYIKFGFGRTTEDAAQEIRSGDLERDEGVALVRRYDGEFPERFAEELFRYMSLPAKEFPEAATKFEDPIMDRAYFEALTNRFRSPHLWTYEGGVWKLRRRVFDQN